MEPKKANLWIRQDISGCQARLKLVLIRDLCLSSKLKLICSKVTNSDSDRRLPTRQRQQIRRRQRGAAAAAKAAGYARATAADRIVRSSARGTLVSAAAAYTNTLSVSVGCDLIDWLVMWCVKQEYFTPVRWLFPLFFPVFLVSRPFTVLTASMRPTHIIR